MTETDLAMKEAARAAIFGPVLTETDRAFSVRDRFPCAEIPVPEEGAALPFQSDKLHLSAGLLFPKETTANLSGAPAALTRDFLSSAADRIRRLSELGIHDARLCPGPEQEDDFFLSLLQRLYPVLLQEHFTLTLPVRIPERTKNEILHGGRFLKRTLMPNVRAALEIRPHELKPGFQAETLIRLLLLETFSVTFVWDADAGNILLPAHVGPWVLALARFGFHGPFLARPLSASGEGRETALNSFAELFRSLQDA